MSEHDLLLHDVGLVQAVERLAEDFGCRYSRDVRIEDEGFPALADERMRVILFRAVRELLMNTATHAGASETCVWLGPEADLLRIKVKDNGAGFDSAGVGLEGYGLFGIREQLRHVGGTMSIDFTPGRGTTVALTAPLRKVLATTA